MSPAVLILVVLLLGVGWMVLVRPQRRRMDDQRALIESIEPGMKILTAGGIYATVVTAEGDELAVELAPGTTVRLDRRAVAGIVEPDEPDEAGTQEPPAAAADAGAAQQGEPVPAGGQPSAGEPS